MRRTTRVLAAALATAVAVVAPGVATAGPSSGSPQKVRCIMLVTQDLTLTANVYCATGTAFRLADGVTLDLNGYRVRGTDRNSGVVITGTATVQNGVLQGWSQAVWLDGDWAAPSTVKNLVIHGGNVRVDNGRVLVQDTQFNDGGVDVSFGRATVERGHFIDSFVDTFQGGAVIKSSTFTRSSVWAGDSQGIEVFDSTFDGQGLTDRGLGCSEAGLALTRTTVANYVTGVSAGGCLGVVEDSVFLHNTTGIDANGSFDLPEAEGVTDVRRNIFEGNGTGAVFSNSMKFTDNVLTDNGIGLKTNDDWIRTIEGNTVTSSTGTGIVAGGPRETLRNNSVSTGGGQGIVAVGSIDGGGNVAFGNAIEPQCDGIICAAG